MIKVALTGNIASGKGLVETIFIENNIKTIDADAICHQLLEKNPEIIEKIKTAFGNKIFDNDTISRQKLGQMIFQDPKKRQILENILHPVVFDKINAFFENNKNEKIVLAVIPLLFETNMEKKFDKVIFIKSDDKIRLERLMKRAGYTEKHALQRMQAQIPQNEKTLKSDYIIENNSTIEELKTKVHTLIKDLTILN